MANLNLLPKSNWNYTTAAHLLNRAGFGGPPNEIQKIADMGLEGAVSYFVDFEKIAENLNADPRFAQPEEGHDTFMDLPKSLLKRKRPNETDEEFQKRMEEEKKLVPEIHEAKRNMALERSENQETLTTWWLNRMAFGPRPFQEKLVLFFHGHFACGGKKCQTAYFRWLQNNLFRQMCYADWEKMLIAVSKDPCMLMSLDNDQNRKEHANENYARELMELYTLGEGQGYTETDVKESARALTGMRTDQRKLCYYLDEKLHDTGIKTFLGLKGNLGCEDICRQIVKQPQAARFLLAKLWTFFTDRKASTQIVDALADEFRSAGNTLKPVMRTMFLSEDFYAPSLIGTQIKSPVQWLVNSVRLLERSMPERKISMAVQIGLGQELFNPPSVKGWDGGDAWMNTNSLLSRYSLAEAVLCGELDEMIFAPGHRGTTINSTDKSGIQNKMTNVMKLFTEDERKDDAKLLGALQKRFLQVPLAPDRVAALQDYLKSRKDRGEETLLCAVRLVMTTPEYQLC